MNIRLIVFLFLSGYIFAQENQEQTRSYPDDSRVMGDIPATGVSGLATAQFTTPISPSTINNNGTQKITRPGYYFLTDDVQFYPKQLWSPYKPEINWQNQTTPKTILYITTDNIILDLNQKTITQNASFSPNPQNPFANKAFQEPNLVAIYIADGVKNVVIKNGTINTVSGCGILIGANCKNITIDNVSIINCAMGGIIAGYNPFDPATYNSVYNAMTLIQHQSPYSCPLNSTQGITISHCSITGSTGYYTYTDTENTEQFLYSHAVGIHLVDCKDIQISNVLCNQHQYSAPTNIKNAQELTGSYYDLSREGYNGYGIMMVRCHNAIIDNTDTSYNSGWAGYGCFLLDSTACTFTHCFARHNQGLADPVRFAQYFTDETAMSWENRMLGRAAGYFCADTSGCTFEHCKATYNKGTRDAAGFWTKRYRLLTSPSNQEPASCFTYTLYNPQTDVPSGCLDDLVSILIGTLIIPALNNFHEKPDLPYLITTTPLYILQGGSNTNTFSMCESYANESVYLSGFGFLTEGNNTNGYHQCTAQGNIAGVGTQNYQPSGLAAYDNGVDNDQSLNAWALYEYERYKNPFTEKIVQHGSGFAIRSTRLPIEQWDDEAHMFKVVTFNGYTRFLGAVISHNDAPNRYVVVSWADLGASMHNCISKENFGGNAGQGIGAYIDFGYNTLLEKNWVHGNKSDPYGTTVYLNDGHEAENIGALGGYGIFDTAENSVTLYVDNYLFGNQIVRPRIITSYQEDGTPIIDWAQNIEGSNYFVQYSADEESFPVQQATVGDFSSLTTDFRLKNIEWKILSPNIYTIKSKIRVAQNMLVFSGPS
jgi:hypothetical protein